MAGKISENEATTIGRELVERLYATARDYAGGARSSVFYSQHKAYADYAGAVEKAIAQFRRDLA